VVQLEAATDPLFGPFLSLGSALTDDWRDRVVDLPPLNLSLAHAMMRRSALVRGLADGAEEMLAELLVRVSAFLVDNPAVRALRYDPFASDGGTLELHPPGQPRPRLALPPYPSSLVGQFTTRDGEKLTIRPIRPEDADAHAAFFARLSPEDVRRRFFSAIREISAEQIVRMTQIDYEREMAFIAEREASHETVGVARLVRETLLNEGEFAIVVQADMKGGGVARHLMERLIAWGRVQGLDAITGEVLSENQPMRSFVRKLGFNVRALPDEPDVVEARLDLREAAA
jgi:acetyltransferase